VDALAGDPGRWRVSTVYLGTIRIKIPENSNVLNRGARTAVVVDLDGTKHVLRI